MRRSRLVFACLAVLGGLLLVATSAIASGPPVVNETDHIVNEVSTDVGVHFCTGAPAELTVVESGVIHFAQFADTVHFTGTLRGTISLDLLPTDGVPDATGTFVVWFGGNGMLLEEGGAFGKAQSAFTMNVKGTNADGTTFNFHQSGNTVFDAAGVPKLDVFKTRAHCR